METFSSLKWKVLPEKPIFDDCLTWLTPLWDWLFNVVYSTRSLSIDKLWATTPRQGASYSNGCGNFFIALVKSFTVKTYMTMGCFIRFYSLKTDKVCQTLYAFFHPGLLFQWFFKHGLLHASGYYLRINLLLTQGKTPFSLSVIH